MGLNITAYRNIKLTEDVERDVYGFVMDYEKYEEITEETIGFLEEHFEGYTEGLSSGVYESAEKFEFRAGSYSGYGMFRNNLGAIAPKEQFDELINFSDCGGCIGPIMSKKIAADFIELEELARNTFEEDDFLLYQCFKKAFELASDNGFVKYS